MGPKAVCKPARKKLSQLKASKLCCDGVAGFSGDSGSTALIANLPEFRQVESGIAEQALLKRAEVLEMLKVARLFSSHCHVPRRDPVFFAAWAADSLPRRI
jgi:hypothetical protein